MEKWDSRVKQETEIDSNGQVAECRRMVSDYCEKYLPVPLYNAAGSALSIAGSSPALTTMSKRYSAVSPKTHLIYGRF